MTLSPQQIGRFWSKVNKDGPIPESCPELGPCWLWTAAIKKGYGEVGFNYKVFRAHRVAYEQSGLIVPDGKELDHLCKLKSCVNPSHLESVSHLVNMSRVHVTPKAQCKRGHPFSGSNVVTYKSSTGAGMRRHCKSCQRIRNAR